MSALCCVVGPTGSGKTALAIEICRRYGGEIVGADASQVYRGLDIGTGKATKAELQGVTHHLIDVVEPWEPFDAACFVQKADAAIAEIESRGKRAVICGGTGFYLRALLHGLCEAPPVSPEIQQTLARRLALGELPQLYAELQTVDPDAAAKIAPQDPQRIERALGVYLTCGQTLSSWQKSHAFQADRYPDRLVIGLQTTPELLKARIFARVDRMIADGFLEEVRGLMAKGCTESLRSMGALGYRLMVDVIEGRLQLEEARQKLKASTWQYARRQRTWFRAQSDVRWFDLPVEWETLAPMLDALWTSHEDER